MADLKKLASLLNVDIPIETKKENEVQPKPTGQRRRAWLLEQDDQKEQNVASSKGVYDPLIEKGSINQVNQPRLSISPINSIDQPLNQKGAIKEAYTPLLLKFSDLRSNPLKLILFLFDISKDEDGKVTKKITQTKIQKTLNLSRDSARTALRFLLKNKLIERVNYKNGKAGWSQYSIKNELFEEIRIGIDKGSIDPLYYKENHEHQKGFNSSNSILNTTTTEDMANFDIEPLKSLGFAETHLMQLLKHDKVMVEHLQESIYAFAYDLERNKKAPKMPINYFMGIMKNNGVYNPPDGYKSPKQRAIEKLLQNEKEAERQENELIEKYFWKWLSARAEKTGKTIDEWRKHYAQEIWPEKKKELYSSA
jgi:hypothetical protein